MRTLIFLLVVLFALIQGCHSLTDTEGATVPFIEMAEVEFELIEQNDNVLYVRITHVYKSGYKGLKLTESNLTDIKPGATIYILSDIILVESSTHRGIIEKINGWVLTEIIS